MSFGIMDEKNIERFEKAKIFVRILPVAYNTDCDCLVKIGDDKKEIYVRSIQDMKRDIRSLKNESPIYWKFQTDGIFYNNSQDEVYRELTEDLLKNILDGANCVLVCYGQTGAGKSFTIAGLTNDYEHRGVIIRFLSDMFEEKRSRKYSDSIEYRLSYVEIISNKVRDLISINNDKREKLKSTGDAFKNLTSAIIKSEEEALKIIFECEARKTIEKGYKYDFSHQGTSILTFHVSKTSLINSWAVTTNSKIHIVDMAGVDSIGKSNCRKTIERVRNANLEKTQMEQFIINLQKSTTMHSQSSSNNLLKYLSGEFNCGSLLRFVGHIRPTEDDIVVTLSLLRFGSNVKKLKPLKIRREFGELGLKLELKKLREENSMLKEELEINESFLNQESIANISSARVEQIERAAIDFVNGSLDDLSLISISQAKILLNTFKKIFEKLKEDHRLAVEQASRDAYDLLAKDYKCSTMSVAKSSKTAITNYNNGNKTKRIKSKSTFAVDRSSKILTSQVSLINENETVTETEKVGEIIDYGVTVGPGRLEPAFGPAVKLMKIKRYEEAQSKSKFHRTDLTMEELSSAEIISNKDNDNGKSVIDCNDEGVKLFLKEDEDAAMFKCELREAESGRKSCEQTMYDLISKYNEIRRELDLSRFEFEKRRNVRRFNCEEFDDYKNRVIIAESEIEWLNAVRRLEIELSETECKIRRAEEELKDLINSELNAIYKIESTFQNSYRTFNEHPLLLPIIFRDNSTLNFNNKNDGIPSGEQSSNEFQQIKSKFNEMQEMMKLMIQNKSTSNSVQRRRRL